MSLRVVAQATRQVALHTSRSGNPDAMNYALMDNVGALVHQLGPGTDRVPRWKRRALTIGAFRDSEAVVDR